MSSTPGELADHLSREETTTVREDREVRDVELPASSPSLLTWLEQPMEDWGLATGILHDVSNVCST
jgi:hypothetical protein